MPWTFYTPRGEIKSDSVSQKAYGSVTYSQFITGNAERTYLSAEMSNILLAGGFAISGATLVIPKTAVYRIDLSGYVNNVNAGTQAYIFVSGAAGYLATRMHIPTVGGTDEGSNYTVKQLTAGEALSAKGWHGDGSSSRLVSGTLMVTEM